MSVVTLSAQTGTISATIHIIPIDGARSLVYAPLRRAAFVANPALAARLNGLRPGDDAPPHAEMLEWLTRMEMAGAGCEPVPDLEPAATPEPTSVTLFLTTACNLRCSYCYARSGDSAPEWMPLDLAKRAVDFVAANAVRRGLDSFEVAYHGGGEPTMHWDVLTASWEHARAVALSDGLRLSSSLATNGALDDAQTDWIVAHLDAATVSVDGTAEVHNVSRRLVGGAGSSEAVFRALSRMDAAGFDYGVRLTVTSANVRSLADSVEHLCSRFGVRELQAEPVYPHGRAHDAMRVAPDVFVAEFLDARSRAARYGRNLRFSPVRPGLLTRHFCAATRDGFAVTPSGQVSACYEAFSAASDPGGAFLYGEADSSGAGFRFDLERWKALRAMSDAADPACGDCFARWHCAGDCPHKRLRGGVADRCHITRELTKYEILTRISQSGGLFWHEPPAQ